MLLRWAGFALGLGLVLAVTGSVLHTVAGPFGRVSRLAAGVGRAVEALGFAAGRRLPLAARHRVLGLVGPMAFLAVLLTWLALYLVGYALLLGPFTTGAISKSGRLAGSSLLTLGFAAPTNVVATLITMAAAATGLLLITLELAYLPSLYAAFNRRETAVILLASRTNGSLTGDAVLLAHADWPAGLEQLYQNWETWAADVIETHGNYPILAAFRSTEPTCSWVYALLAMLDAAALHDTLLPHRCPAAAARLLAIGQRCVTTLAVGNRLSHSHQTMALHGLEHLDLPRLSKDLTAAGLAPEALATAWTHLNDHRRAYAPTLDRLAHRLALDPPTLPTSRQNEATALDAAHDNR
jgi:hypothetical protein